MGSPAVEHTSIILGSRKRAALLNNGLVSREHLAFAPTDGSDPTAPFEPNEREHRAQRDHRQRLGIAPGPVVFGYAFKVHSIQGIRRAQPAHRRGRSGGPLQPRGSY